VRKEDFESRTVLALKDLHLLKLVRKGDFVISLRSFQGGIEFARHQGIISPAYTVLYPVLPTMHGYLSRLLKSKPYIENLGLHVTGIRQGQNIDYEKLARSVLPVPPPTEQAAIARFIDFADHQIRRHVRAKQQLIGLLEEYKKAIIHRAVTCGVNLSVPMKATEIPAQPSVPASWEVTPIKRLFSSMVYGISESAANEGAIRLLTMGHIKNGEVEVPLAGGVSSVDSSLLVRPNDLLFNRTNSPELVGKVGLFRGAPTDVTFASYLVRMRPRPTHDPEYISLLLNDSYVLSMARREAIPSLHQANLNPTRYGRLKVALPSRSEQTAILEYIKEVLDPTVQVIERSKQEIELVREYRTRLIADVVTGKLDVREAAAALPEELDEAGDLTLDDTLAGDDEAELAEDDATDEEVVA
jgi:type I restriction enzyme S subunit